MSWTAAAVGVLLAVVLAVIVDRLLAGVAKDFRRDVTRMDAWDEALAGYVEAARVVAARDVDRDLKLAVLGLGITALDRTAARSLVSFLSDRDAIMAPLDEEALALEARIKELDARDPVAGSAFHTAVQSAMALSILGWREHEKAFADRALVRFASEAQKRSSATAALRSRRTVPLLKAA